MIKYCILVAFWFLYLVTSANAGPIAAAVTAFVGFLGSGTIIAQIVGLAIMTAAKTLLARAFAKKQDDREPGIRTQMQVGGTNPLSFLVGYIATAGQLEYVNTWGKADKTENAYLTLVISLSDIPITALLPTMWIAGEKHTIDFASVDNDQPTLGNPILGLKQDGRYYGWVRFHDGNQTLADSLLTSKFAADPDRPWTAEMIGTGVAYVVVTLRLNRAFFTGSVPNMRFETQGIKLYNPAKDSTNGGVGAVRWNDPATWQYEQDNASAIYNITRGVHFDGTWIYGGQNLPQTLLPSATWIAAYNECDDDIALEAGGTEKQFRCGYEVVVSQEPLSVIERFLDNCGGRMAEIGGFYKIKIGAPGPAVYTFTDGDIVATHELDYDPFPGIQQTFNGVHARYPEPGEAWELKDAPPYYNSEWETDDESRRLVAKLNLDTTFSNTQVQRVVQAAAKANRRFRRHIVPLPPEAALIEPAIDTVAWNSTREGYAGKEFIVLAATCRPGMINYLQILEIDPADYNWTPATDEKPYSIGYVGTVRPPAQASVGWSVEPYILFDAAANARRPTLMVEFPGDLEDIKDVKITVRLAADESNVSFTTVDYGEVGADNTSKFVTLAAGPYLPVTGYEVQGQFVSYSGRIIDPTPWLGPVITDNVQFTGADLAPGSVSITQFADSITPVELLPAVPSNSDPANFEGRLVYNTTTGILWTFTDGAWVQMVANNVLDGSITAAKIADSAVIASKIATDAVTSIKIAADAVSAVKIATGAVLSAKIADNAVTVAKITDGAIISAKLADSAVTVAKLADNAVNSAKILDAAISLTKFAAGIRPVEIVATLPVTGNIEGRLVYLTTDDKLYRWTGAAWTAAVPSTDITGQLTDAQIAAIAAAKLTGQITGTQITDGAISTPKLAAGSVTTAVLAAGAVVADKIAANAVTAAAILAGSITTAKLAAGAVTANELAANSVIAGKIAAAAVSANEIAANAVLTKHMVISNYVNQVPNPNFAAGFADWNPYANPSKQSVVVNSGYPGGAAVLMIGETGAGAISLMTHGDLTTDVNAGIDVQPGEEYYISATLNDNGTGVQVLRLYAYIRFADDTQTAFLVYTADDSMSGWNDRGAAFTVPANAKKMRLGFIWSVPTTGAFWFITNARITRRNDGNLIVDGAITAGKLAANSVTAAAIAAGTITATEIATGAITAIKLAAGSVTAAAILAGTITATEIATGAITAIKIAANAVTAAAILAGTITGDKIAAATIFGDRIVANSLTTRELIMTNFENLVPNTGFTSNTLTDWVIEAGAAQIIIAANSTYPSGYAVRYQGNGALIQIKSHNVGGGIDVKAGEEYYISMAVTRSGTPSNLLLYGIVEKTDGSLTSLLATSIAPVGGWNTYGGMVTMPADAKKMRILVQWGASTAGSFWFFTNVSCYLRKDANLIVDGAITAGKLAANSVTAGTIAANAVTAGKVAAGAIGATQISVTNLSAINANMGAITAGTITFNAASGTAYILMTDAT